MINKTIYNKKYLVVALVALTAIILYGRGVPSFFTTASGSAVSFAISEPHLSSFAKPVTPGQYNFA